MTTLPAVPTVIDGAFTVTTPPAPTGVVPWFVSVAVVERALTSPLMVAEVEAVIVTLPPCVGPSAAIEPAPPTVTVLVATVTFPPAPVSGDKGVVGAGRLATGGATALALTLPLTVRSVLEMTTAPPAVVPSAVTRPAEVTIAVGAATAIAPPLPCASTPEAGAAALAVSVPLMVALDVAATAMAPPWVTPVAATLPPVETETVLAVTTTAPPDPWPTEAGWLLPDIGALACALSTPLVA